MKYYIIFYTNSRLGMKSITLNLSQTSLFVGSSFTNGFEEEEDEDGEEEGSDDMILEMFVYL